MNTQKVAFFTPHLRIGGVEAVVVDLANFFASSRLQVDLIVGDDSGENRDKVNSSVNIVSLGRQRMRHMIIELRHYIKKGQPSVIFSNKPHAIIAAEIARKSLISQPLKHVGVFHSFESPPLPGYDRTLSSSIMRFINQKLYQQLDHIVTVSNALRAAYLERYNLRPSQITAIHNPFPISSIQLAAAQTIDYRWLYSGERVIISVGRLEPEKRLDLLIASFAIAREHINARLIIVGDGSQREPLRHQANMLEVGSYIEFMGYQSNPYAFMANADLLVSTSPHEGFGNVIVEALAVGTPVLATDPTGGPGEILTNTELGILSNADSAQTIAKQIVEALERTYDKNILIDHALRFDITSIGNKYLELACELLL